MLEHGVLHGTPYASLNPEVLSPSCSHVQVTRNVQLQMSSFREDALAELPSAALGIEREDCDPKPETLSCRAGEFI